MVGEVEAAEMQLNSGGDMRPRADSLSISRKFRPRSQSQVRSQNQLDRLGYAFLDNIGQEKV